MALALFPQHFGALSGIGLAYEKLGNNSSAIATLRHALDVHPWAANLPTVLMSHERRYDHKEKFLRRGTTVRTRRVADEDLELVSGDETKPADAAPAVVIGTSSGDSSSSSSGSGSGSVVEDKKDV